MIPGKLYKISFLGDFEKSIFLSKSANSEIRLGRVYDGSIIMYLKQENEEDAAKPRILYKILFQNIVGYIYPRKLSFELWKSDDSR